MNQSVKKTPAHQVGTVKWFDNAKGYGFLVGRNGSDIFVHYKSILVEGFKTLIEGQQVQYRPIQNDRGPAAAEVTPL